MKCLFLFCYPKESEDATGLFAFSGLGGDVDRSGIECGSGLVNNDSGLLLGNGLTAGAETYSSNAEYNNKCHNTLYFWNFICNSLYLFIFKISL